MGREITIPLIRVFRRMDDGSISMQVGDNDLNSSFSHGEVSHPRNVPGNYWICFLCLSYSMQGRAMHGNSRQNRARSMDEAKVSESRAWICLRRECLAVTSRILIELMASIFYYIADCSYRLEGVYR